MASTVVWIWLVGMLGSKIVTFGPKFGWSDVVSGAPGLEAGTAAAGAARAGAAWGRSIPPKVQRKTTSESMRRRATYDSVLISNTFFPMGWAGDRGPTLTR